MARDNWSMLQVRMGEQLFESVCHHYGRKLDSFHEACENTVTISKEAYNLLDYVLLYDDTGAELPSHVAGGIFVAEVDGVKYLVNTEGYSYSRYIAKLKVK